VGTLTEPTSSIGTSLINLLGVPSGSYGAAVPALASVPARSV